MTNQDLLHCLNSFKHYDLFLQSFNEEEAMYELSTETSDTNQAQFQASTTMDMQGSWSFMTCAETNVFKRH